MIKSVIVMSTPGSVCTLPDRERSIIAEEITLGGNVDDPGGGAGATEKVTMVPG